MQTRIEITTILIGLLLAGFFTVFFFLNMKSGNTFAGVSIGNEYQSTTTVAAVTGTFDGLEVLRTGQGSLGSVTITGANTGRIVFYDATTSDSTLRSGSRASSTIVIADIAASVAAGTYTFDAEFTDGLLMSRLGGDGPTSTVMWR